MKIFSKCMSLLGSVLALLLCVTPAFAAAGTTADLDLSKTGSITLTLKDGDGNVKTGGFLDCIEVAQVADNGNGLTYILSNGFEDTDVSLQDFLAGKESAASLAERLSKVVPKDAEKVARRPDKNGTVTFPDCELGMYLIRQRTKSGYYEAITPFVVTVPLNTEDGWVQRAVKSVAEWNKIFRTKGRAQFPKNSVLVPTKIRKSGRIHLARIPLHVSSNFTVFSYDNAEAAEIIASYMTTVFYQLDCEIQAKMHAGVRKQDMRDIIKTYVPKVDLITKEARDIIKNEIPNIVFLNLNQPQIRKIDIIWAEILFGSNSGKYLTEAQRLLRFLANRRNPRK